MAKSLKIFVEIWIAYSPNVLMDETLKISMDQTLDLRDLQSEDRSGLPRLQSEDLSGLTR